MLEIKNVSYKTGGKKLVEDVSFNVEHGSMCALLGPNGAGKSTLLKTVSGELTASAGKIFYDEKDIYSYVTSEISKRRAVLSQKNSGNFPFTAYEIALMGRMPHLKGMFESNDDHEITRQAMREVEVDAFSERYYPTLSGGEGHRVDMARLLAQVPELLLLDEPTNHLDPAHQLQTLHLFRRLADKGKTILIALHDLNLASLFCDRVVLMKNGRLSACGEPEKILTGERIKKVYGFDCTVLQHPNGCPWIVPAYEHKHRTREPEAKNCDMQMQAI